MQNYLECVFALGVFTTRPNTSAARPVLVCAVVVTVSGLSGRINKTQRSFFVDTNS